MCNTHVVRNGEFMGAGWWTGIQTYNQVKQFQKGLNLKSKLPATLALHKAWNRIYNVRINKKSAQKNNNFFSL